MEYHFTGTGASPDFTFIADAIVDSVGNRIFYSSIKKTKIKVKSNTAVLLITTVVEGVKSEHGYSIRKSDKEALKAAIAEIGLNVAVTKRPKLRIHFKKKTVVVLLVLTFAIGCGTAWRVNNANNEKIRAQKENAVNTIIEIAKSYALEDVSVELRDIEFDGYKWYYADITCSNWGQLKPRQMLNTYQKWMILLILPI